MQPDPRHLIERAAAKAAENCHPQAPPVDVVLQNSRVDVGDQKDAESGEMTKVIVVTHSTGGLRVFIPMPLAAARIIGNALCDRPNITLP